MASAELLFGGVFGFIGYILSGFGSRILASIGGGAGGVTRSLGSGTGGFGSRTCGVGGGVRRSARGFLGFFHGGGRSLFSLLAGGQCKGGEQCDEKFRLHGDLPECV